ncbi:MAG TPA: DUF4142 domain-containing protein [Chthoniobacterales bacterium]
MKTYLRSFFSVLSAALLAAVVLPEAAVQAAKTGPRETEAQLAKNDEKFVLMVSQGGMTEVRLGELAREKATRPEVKEFGAMMATDHSKVDSELRSFASGRGITLSAMLDRKHAAKVERLSKLSGAEFDKEYVEEVVKDHRKVVDAFEDASKDAADPALKTWATKTLPTLQAHLERIEAIQKQK